MTQQSAKRWEVQAVEELLQKAQRGDEKAFLELFAMYENQMYRIAFVHVKNEADALDVMQEVAYRMFKNIGTVKNAEYFKTWLTRITMNCAVGHIRKNSKVVQIGTEYLENVEEISESYEREILLGASLEELMVALDAEEKNVILLKYYYEYSFQEMSEILKRPLGTVKSVLYRALKKLKEKAKEVHLDETDY